MFGKPKSNSGDENFDEGAEVGDESRGETESGGGNGNGGGFLLDRSKPSVISEGFTLQGDISASGVLHVEGFIKGTVRTDAVNIGPRGAVEGKVMSKTLHVKGAFVGTAECDDLFIASKARVVGRITYRSVAIQRGAMIEGDLIHAA
jgi:cytoskeletal protein CcmA (bactofilin family)